MPVLWGLFQWATSFCWQEKDQLEFLILAAPPAPCWGSHPDSAVSGPARTRWPCRLRWSAGLWSARRFQQDRRGRWLRCSPYVHASGGHTQTCWPPGSDGRWSGRRSRPRDLTDTRHSGKEMKGRTEYCTSKIPSCKRNRGLMFFMEAYCFQ